MSINLNHYKYKSVGSATDEAQVHKEIAAECKHGIVELGVLNGDTTKIFCETNLNIKIFGIDPIIPDSMNASLIGNKEKILKLCEKYKNFTFINDYSFNVVKNFNEKFDYLFIDADHEYEAVKKDYLDWFPKLENGGYIGFHDSSANRGGPYWWGGPSKLTDELILENKLEYVKTIFTLTVFRKK